MPVLENHRISINAFDELRHAIANDKAAEVPPSIFEILRSVIRRRKECAAWFIANQSNASDTMKENNEGHRHFIAVLEGVLRILKVKERRPRKAVPQTTSPAINHITNVYERLHLENTIELDDISEAVPLPTPSGVYKLEPLGGETSFAIFCFLRDLTSIRIYVRKNWREFKNGHIALQTAALAMNAAIAKIEAMCNEFRTDDAEIKATNHAVIISFIYKHCCSMKDNALSIRQSEGEETEDQFAYDHDGQKLRASTMMCFHTTDLVIRCILNSEKDHRLTLDEKRFLKTLSQFASTPMAGPEQSESVHGDLVHKTV